MYKYISAIAGTIVVSALFPPLFEGSSMFPPYLIAFTGILIILTAIAILIRLGIYQHLRYLSRRVSYLIDQEPRGKKPKIVEELERRVYEMHPNLEQLNTSALIDRVYSQYLYRNEQLDYLCRFFPNLLLALGLLGTFLGITINLNLLSQTINEFGVGSIDDLITQVQRPLQGMGIAFISSLTAVTCSAILTIVNLLRNTTIAKYQLIGNLEDYLTNIYEPALGKRSPLDKAVDRIEGLLNNLGDRFAIAVSQAVETSLGGKVDQIVEGNREANHLATQVYNRFMESASSMMSGATIFRESAQTFERTQFANKLASSTEHLATTQRDLSRSAAVLNQSTQGIQLAIASLQSTSQEMIHLGEQVGNISKKSTQVLDVTEANQQSLGQIVAQLQQSAEIFHSVMKTIDALQKRMTTGGDRFVEVQGELTRLVDLLQVYTEQMNIGITKLGDRLVAALREETSPDRDRGQVVASRISKLGNDLNSVQAQLTELVESLNSPESAENTLIQPPTSSQEDNTNPFNPNLLNSEEDEK
jgi:hypothetical protein